MRKRLLFLASVLVLWLFGGVFMMQSIAAPRTIEPILLEMETRDYKNSVPLILDMSKTTLPQDLFIYDIGRKNHRY